MYGIFDPQITISVQLIVFQIKTKYVYVVINNKQYSQYSHSLTSVTMNKHRHHEKLNPNVIFLVTLTSLYIQTMYKGVTHPCIS